MQICYCEERQGQGFYSFNSLFKNGYQKEIFRVVGLITQYLKTGITVVIQKHNPLLTKR